MEICNELTIYMKILYSMDNQSYFKTIVNEAFSDIQNGGQLKRTPWFKRGTATAVKDKSNPDGSGNQGEKVTLYPSPGGLVIKTGNNFYIQPYVKKVHVQDGKIASEMGLGRMDGFTFIFREIKVGPDANNAINALKDWCRNKTAGGNTPMMQFVSILADSKFATYMSDINNGSQNPLDGKGEIITRDNMLLAAREFISKIVSNVKERGQRNVDDVKRLEVDEAYHAILQAMKNGEYGDLLEKYGGELVDKNRVYGHTLSPKNVKQIIATALANGLQPGNPRWPTYVRPAHVWRKFGLYVCDDPAGLIDQNGNPVIDPATGKPRELREPILYPFDASIKADKQTIKGTNRGLAIMGHDLKVSDIGGFNNQLADKAHIEVARTAGGVRGIAYDISDVVEIPGTNALNRFLNVEKGLRNNLTGELNQAAQDYEEAKKAEFNERMEKFKQDAMNDPELSAAAEKSKTDVISAEKYNIALERINSRLANKFKFFNTGNAVGDFINNIFSWAKDIIEGDNFPKDVNFIANLVVCSVCLQCNVGQNRVNVLGGVGEAFRYIEKESSELARAEFLKVQDSILEMLKRALIEIEIETDDEKRPEAQQAQSLAESFMRMTKRMNSLSEYGYGRR